MNGETVAVSASAGVRDLYQRNLRSIPIRDVIDFTSILQRQTPESVAYAVCYLRSEAEERKEISHSR